MKTTRELIQEAYGNKVRVRVCGILVKNDAILLINHIGVGDSNTFWGPPGGGIEFGESIEETLVREFKEECSIDISVGNFIQLNEFINPPFHAIELFYRVYHINGEIQLGNDPETNSITLKELKFFNMTDLKNIQQGSTHNCIENIIKKIIER